MKRARALSLAAVIAVGCTPHPHVPAAPIITAPPLHLAPLGDLAPAGGLVWIVEARPRVFFSDPSLIAALAEVFPERRLDTAAKEQGGLDLRAIDDLVAAGYPGTTLLLAHQVIDPARVEAAFAARVADVEGRAIDRGGDDPRGVLIRAWGARGTGHETVVVFGHEAVGLALGDGARLRAAELFAEDKLKRAQPAWRRPPLDRVADLLGDAPLRAAAPGPFAGAWSAGVGGLLAAATAAGVAVRVEDDGTAQVHGVLTGPWGERAADAQQRLQSSYKTLTDSGLGHLLGLHHPASPPRFISSTDVVGFDVQLQIEPLVRGLADATTTGLQEMMTRPLP